MADIQLPAFPAAAVLNGSDLMWTRQGATDKKITAAEAKAFFGDNTYQPNVNYSAALNDIVKGSNGTLYQCLIDNGPASTIVDPVGDLTETWDLSVRGEFGLGSRGNPPAVTNADDATDNGFYRLDAPFSSAPTPEPLTILTQTYDASIVQIASDPINLNTWYRRFNGVSWSGWILFSTEINSFAQGQTRQDLSGSRLAGVLYTNSTGRPIEVSVAVTSVTGATGSAQIVSDGFIIDYGFNQAVAGITTVNSVCVTIPNGSDYTVIITGTITTWSELR